MAALLLATTAAVHVAGASMLDTWLEGQRRQLLLSAWYLLALDWLVVALIWAFCGWRNERRLAPLTYLAALIPAATTIALVVVIGPGFFGVWMLAAAIGLALAGAWRLR